MATSWWTGDDAQHLVPADRIHFPEGKRLNTTLIDAQFTSGDGHSHVLSLGEFAALYLSAWSPAIWGKNVASATFAKNSKDLATTEEFSWAKELPPYTSGEPGEGAIVMPAIETPQEVAGHLYAAPVKPPEPKKKPTEKEQARKAFEAQRSLRRQFAVLQEFREGLPKVQRALANVPTYMIFDDHDVTDDCFLNPLVARPGPRADGSASHILGNAMIAYALFQDWGNDPAPTRTDAKPQLLALDAEQLFPDGEHRARIGSVRQQIATAASATTAAAQRRLGRRVRRRPSRRSTGTSASTARSTVSIAFDNRTRRSYVVARTARRATCRSTRRSTRSRCRRCRPAGRS